jgi:hypothetical protein
MSYTALAHGWNGIFSSWPLRQRRHTSAPPANRPAPARSRESACRPASAALAQTAPQQRRAPGHHDRHGPDRHHHPPDSGLLGCALPAAGALPCGSARHQPVPTLHSLPPRWQNATAVAIVAARCLPFVARVVITEAPTLMAGCPCKGNMASLHREPSSSSTCSSTGACTRPGRQPSPRTAWSPDRCA